MEKYALFVLRKVLIDVLVLGLLGGTLYGLKKIDPFQRGFFCGDESIMYPYRNNTVTTETMRIVGILLPVITITACELVNLWGRKEEVRRCAGVPVPAWLRGVYSVLLSFGAGVLATELATEVSKVTIGRLRPCFLQCAMSIALVDSFAWHDASILRTFFLGWYLTSELPYTAPGQHDRPEDARVVPNETIDIVDDIAHYTSVCVPSVNCSLAEYQGRYVPPEEFSCTNPGGYSEHTLRDTRLSFVSGHSSWAAFTMIYLALYLHRRMTWQVTRLPRYLLQFTAIMLSWFTALSRVSDNKHHWSDVLAGYSLGATFAVVAATWCTQFVERRAHAPLPQQETAPSVVTHVHRPL